MYLSALEDDEEDVLLEPLLPPAVGCALPDLKYIWYLLLGALVICGAVCVAVVSVARRR